MSDKLQKIRERNSKKKRDKKKKHDKRVANLLKEHGDNAIIREGHINAWYYQDGTPTGLGSCYSKKVKK
jgi:hypothetical protein